MLTARIAQGISTGGEVGNSYAYLYEVAPADRKGRYASIGYISTGSATLVASLLGYWITSEFDSDTISSWGWRVPFVVGAALGVIVLWLRTSMAESTEYVDNVSGAEPVSHPLWMTLRHYPRSVLRIIGMVSMTTVVYYTLTNALKTYATTPTKQGGTIGASESQAFLALSIGMLVFVALQYPFGALADRVGRRNTLLACGAIFVVISVPLSTLLTADTTNLVVVFAVGLGLFAMATSVAPAVLSDQLPPQLRGVGIGAWCNLAVALFGGTAPLIVTALTAAGHTDWFFWYISIVCAFGVAALLTMRDERRHAVPADSHQPLAGTCSHEFGADTHSGVK
ncbi:MFS transporter [Streptomyces sp. NPDC102364]|uniref:MFS transporter n=1 Tax=Streptomyces sp. NPDC102364 TaxID=3366161 RepID=UPI0038300550